MKSFTYEKILFNIIGNKRHSFKENLIVNVQPWSLEMLTTNTTNFIVIYHLRLQVFFLFAKRFMREEKSAQGTGIVRSQGSFG